MATAITILIADDDAEDRFILSDAFKEIGFSNSIKFVDDGTEVISLLQKNNDVLPTLIILDLNMPKLNGTETLRMLKAHNAYSNIPVMIFSTSVNELEKKQCLEMGALEYLTKPTTYKASLNIAKYFQDTAEKMAV